MGSRVRIRLFHILHFGMHFLFPLLKNSKSGVDDRGHRLRSGSPVTNLPGALAPKCIYEYVIRTTEFIIRMKNFLIGMKIVLSE